jgi:superfamily II DNA or RNA helicase
MENIENIENIKKIMTQDVSYPDPDDPELQLKLYNKREFYYHIPKNRPNLKDYDDIKEYRDEMCGKKFVLNSYQSLLPNFINPNTPYKGTIVFCGLGVGKCVLGSSLVYVNGNLTKIEDLWNNNDTDIVVDTDGGEWKIPNCELIVNSYCNIKNKIIKNPVTKLYRESIDSFMREIELENGQKITITYAHKLLKQYGEWTNDLHIGDNIYVPNVFKNQFIEKSNFLITTDLAYFIGHQIFNGKENNNLIRIYNDDVNILAILQQAFTNITTQYKLKSERCKIMNGYIEIISNDYMIFLKSAEYNIDEIPDFIMNSSKFNVGLFMSSFKNFENPRNNKDYFEINNSINKKKINILTKITLYNECDDIIASKIINIIDVKHNGFIYDLEVDGTHNFVIENILCHNTAAAINVAEGFKPLVSKYNTKIIVLVGGPLIKENWKKEFFISTGETYLKYQDKTSYTDASTRDKQEKIAWSQILQYYKFMSYKSFYRHVIGEKISEKQEGDKNKAIYKKTDEGEFERDISIDRIYNLNNTLIIVDEAHNLTENSYGNALKHMIKNSTNLKILLLTATPMKNLGSDIVELVNFLRPLNNQIEKSKIFDNNKGHLMGFKTGGLEYLKNMMRGYVSHLRGSDPLTFGKRVDKGIIPKGLLFTKVTRCIMEEFQKKTYTQSISESINDSLDRKSEAVANFVFPGLTPDKKQLMGFYAGSGLNFIKNQLKVNEDLLNKKLSIMLFGHENEKKLIYLTDDEKYVTGKIYKMPYLKNFSIKFYKTVKKLNRLVWGKKGASTAFIYSNLVKVGISLFHEILLQNGYLEYQNDSSHYEIKADTVCYFCGKCYSKHGLKTEEYTEDNIESDDTNDTEDTDDTDDTDDTNNKKKSKVSKSLSKISDSSSEYEKKNIKKHIPQHIFRPATFITITGKSSEEEIDVLPEEKKKTLDMVFNNLENRDGRYIKFVLGSRVMNEGISLKNVGEVHILDAYYNFGRVDQVIGRAIRNCSHYKLMTRENPYPEVRVYKYVVALKEGLSTEEELYKKAETKYLLIKKIERGMKEVSIDCPLNLNNNMFKEEIDKYAKCDGVNPNNPCPAICDYTKCDYLCDETRLNAEFYDPERKMYKKITRNKLDYSTFTQSLARNEIDFSKEKIKELYIIDYMYSLEQILTHVKNEYIEDKKDLFDEFFVFKALDELIPNTENDFNNFKDTILDKGGRAGYLIFINIYYIFQPFDEVENVPMYYRTTIPKHITKQVSLYNYIKNHSMYDKFKEHTGKREEQIEKESREDKPFYDFENTMEYYDSREENKYVGIIDKELSRRKNKSIDEIKDVFKLREQRPKVVEKKRQSGLPSFAGSVCVNSKSKKYLLHLLEKINAPIPTSLTRTDICESLQSQLLLLEKYGTVEQKTNKTFIITPLNNPKYPFPYNLENRVEDRKQKIKKEIGSKTNITVKKIKKTSGNEKGMTSYELYIPNDEKTKNHLDFITDMGFVKKGNEFVLLLE